MCPKVNVPQGELIECWALAREIAKASEPDLNQNAHGIECIVAKMPQPVTLPDGSKLPVAERSLTPMDREHLSRLMPGLPELKIPYPDDVAESFLGAFRALQDRPSWEPVVLTKRRYLWECDQVVGRRWQRAAEHLRQLQHWLNIDRIKAFQRPHVPTTELTFGSRIPRRDVFAYLDYCEMAYTREDEVQEVSVHEVNTASAAPPNETVSLADVSESQPTARPARTVRPAAMPEVVDETSTGPLVVPSGRLLDIKEVSECTGISVSMLHEKMKCGSKYFDSSFPPKISLGARTVRYAEAAVNDWIQACLSAASGKS